MLQLIVAADLDHGIGCNNRLPWKLKTDMQFFKAMTMGHTVIMGRKTLESIGKALPGRKCYVLTTNPNCPNMREKYPDVVFTSDIGALSRMDAFLIGGKAVYELMLPYVSKIFLTEVDGHFECDVQFKVNLAEWAKVSEVPLGRSDYDAFDMTLLTYMRK